MAMRPRCLVGHERVSMVLTPNAMSEAHDRGFVVGLKDPNKLKGYDSSPYRNKMGDRHYAWMIGLRAGQQAASSSVVRGGRR